MRILYLWVSFIFPHLDKPIYTDKSFTDRGTRERGI